MDGEVRMIRVGDKDWNWGMTMETQIDELLAEVKKLRDKITLMEMQYVGLEQAYYDSPAETENKRLRELLVEAAHCIHEMEGMAYAEADPDDFAKHAMEFRGNVSTTIGADAPWGDEE